MLRFSTCFCCVLAVAAGDLLAASPEQRIEAAEPVAFWSFQEPPSGKTTGTVRLSDAGPAPPEFPDFEPGNRALSFAAPASLRVADEGQESRFDFDQGDTITLEAWVNLHSLRENAYIVGKGRTGNPGVEADNQNWALRLRSRGGEACVNFLFRSRADEEKPADWHRWTSSRGFSPGSGWHHVAIIYTFGKPASMRGYLDGRRVEGAWDMGGATSRPPVVDDDEVWLGSAMAGAPSNSLDGKIDEVALYRHALTDEELASRFRYRPQPLETPNLPEGKVLVQLLGPIDGIRAIPDRVGSLLTQWEQSTLGFVRLPHRYDEWGIREDWGKTLLVRAWHEVQLEPGDYQLLVRSRGLARLWVDDQLLATTPPQKNRGGAHHVVDPLPDVPLPGMRPRAMNDSEQLVEFTSSGGQHLVRFECIVGGPGYRTEFGETCVAIAQPGGMFHVLSTTSSFALTDAGWTELVARQEAELIALDTQRRRAANGQLADYWQARHDFARSALIAGDGPRDLDEIIRARIQNESRGARMRSDGSDSGAHLFHEQVQPILATHCYRCHGEKEKGGLNLQRRENLLAGGDSELPAVVPGDPEESYLLELVTGAEDDLRMPPEGEPLSGRQVAVLRAWIAGGAAMPKDRPGAITLSPPIDDYTFLRRVYLDTVGVAPSLAEIHAFLDDPRPDRRARWIDRLLDDPRWADNWVGYWQDALAENPNLLKPTLNNTGPFRWWIHEALRDNKPLDRFATELILMRGSAWGGGTAGFAIASQNDVPMAAKAHVIGSAFLGAQLKCARCHDAPFHDWKQRDLFQLAAMLGGEDLRLPETSTVPPAFFEEKSRQPLIDVTLEPGELIHADWPFADFDSSLPEALLLDPEDSRQRLAAQVTSSRRFAEVLANRIWARLMGRALVEPVDDWEGNPPSDPALLAALADELIDSDYDLKQLARRIFLSDAYQRQAINLPAGGAARARYFEGPYRRRMTAEQIVDTSLAVVGLRMETEPLTLDVEGTLPADRFLHFGRPRRAWEFTTLANERDRPSLALPRAQAIADVLKAFGWRNARPQPIASREEAPNLIQPGVLSGGVLGTWLTRLSDDSQITALAREEQPVAALVDSLFLKILTRPATPQERARFVALLQPGYEQRLVPPESWGPPPELRRYRYVSWSNHLNSEANSIKIEMEKEVREGPPPTRYLTTAWRERAEDAVWALLNSPEMILIP